MDFDLSDEHEAVRELARAILTDHGDPDRLAALGDVGVDRAAWQALADAGLLGVALPAAVGGGDLGSLAIHLLLEEVGRSGVRVPLLETLVLGALPLARFDPAGHADLLAAVIGGDRLLTAAIEEGPGSDPADPATTVSVHDGRSELRGEKTLVPFGEHADAALVTARDEAGQAVAVLVPLDAPGVVITSQGAWADVPHAAVTLDGAAGDVVAGGPEVVPWLLRHATAGLASLQSGTCAAVVALTAAYTSQREQFGRPVATFQAVSQRVADAFIDAEVLRLTALQAAWLLDADLAANDAVAVAKFWAAEAGHRVLHAAHHVHGGVGVDREYPLHRALRRAKRAEFVLGGATEQLRKLGRSIAAQPHDDRSSR